MKHPGKTTDTPTALLAVDVQSGFLPGGALGVADGDLVIPPLLAAAAQAHLIVLSRDWHPPDHISFVAQGGPWPAHCVQGTPDAEIDRQLLAASSSARNGETLVVSKGMDPMREAYSAFDGVNLKTGMTLAEELGARGVMRLQVGGLATDYCVKATVLDAIAADFEVELLASATRPVEANPGDGARAIAEMRAAGAQIAGPPEP